MYFLRCDQTGSVSLILEFVRDVGGLRIVVLFFSSDVVTTNICNHADSTIVLVKMIHLCK